METKEMKNNPSVKFDVELIKSLTCKTTDEYLKSIYSHNVVQREKMTKEE